MNKLITILTLVFFTSQIFGQTVSTLAGPSTGINDAISVDSKGNIYGSYYNSSFNGSSIYKVSPQGVVSVFADGFNCTNGSTIDNNDNLYVVNVASGYQNQIYKITPDGVKTPLGPIISGAAGILKDPNSDTLYVGCYPNKVIGKLAPDGSYFEAITGGELDGPVGLAFDELGNLYAANYGNGKIFKIKKDGSEISLIAQITGTGFGAIGFLTYARGNLYATGIGKHRIYRVSTEGEFVELIGTGSSGTTNGSMDSARFANPNGIALSITGDSLFISDYSTQSIRIIANYDADIEVIPPTVDSIIVSTNKKLRVYFSERLNETSAKNKENYAFSDDIQLSVISFYTSIKSYVDLNISEIDLENENYSITISNIYDAHNNVISDTTIYFNQVATSISNSKTSVELYPNPISNNLLNISSHNEISLLEIFDINGRSVYTRKNINENYFAIEIKENSGLYFARIILENGSILNYKLIIQ